MRRDAILCVCMYVCHAHAGGHSVRQAQPCPHRCQRPCLLTLTRPATVSVCMLVCVSVCVCACMCACVCVGRCVCGGGGVMHGTGVPMGARFATACPVLACDRCMDQALHACPELAAGWLLGSTCVYTCTCVSMCVCRSIFYNGGLNGGGFFPLGFNARIRNQLQG